jgi:hypothetical protein
MGSYCWKGVTTKRRYEWIQATIPSALLSVYGQPLQVATYNGETLVATNHDGSVMMPTATGPPPGAVTYQPGTPSELNSVFDAYVQQSPWTEQ